MTYVLSVCVVCFTVWYVYCSQLFIQESQFGGLRYDQRDVEISIKPNTKQSAQTALKLIAIYTVCWPVNNYLSFWIFVVWESSGPHQM